MRIVSFIACVLIAIFLSGQVLGLVFIERIASQTADPTQEVHIPLSVRTMGYVANKLHDDVLGVPMTSDGSRWSKALRWFFALELCGLTCLAVAFWQVAFAVLNRRDEWFQQSGKIIVWSLMMFVAGILLLLLTQQTRVSEPDTAPTPHYEIPIT